MQENRNMITSSKPDSSQGFMSTSIIQNSRITNLLSIIFLKKNLISKHIGSAYYAESL